MRQKIYIITSETHLKIGISVNPEKRVRELSTGSALKLNLYSEVMPLNISASEMESKLHRQFKEHRCNGEWFDICCLEEALVALNCFRRGTINTAICDKSLNATMEEITYLGALFFTTEQVIALGKVCSKAYIVMQFYVAISHEKDPNMEDSQIAALTGLSEQTVKRTRLALTKAGWFMRIKDTYKGQLKLTYLVGKAAVEQTSQAVLKI